MGKTGKLDLYREHKADYAASNKAPALVEVSPAQYLAVEGRGAPGGEAFQAKVAAIYSAAFTIKMTRKFSGMGDYKVCQLEGLWWADSGNFMDQPRDQWRWKLLIRTPDFVSQSDLARAKQALRDKGKPPDFEQVQLERIDEGLCVQMLHVGPYAGEGRTVEAMLGFAAEKGLSVRGLHHEIYLSDPRRVAPDRLRTILRLPVAPAVKPPP